MASYSDYLEDAILNHVFRNSALTSPTTVYVALYTAAPSDSGGGTQVSGNGYSRQSAAFGAPSGGVITNSGTITFTASGGNWGTITHFGIFDASTNGNLLAWAPLTTSRTVNDGDSLVFAASALSITQT